MTVARETAAAAPRGTFTIDPRGAFSLASSIRFLEGFAPAAYEAAGSATLDFAFALEGSWQVVGVSLEQVGSQVRGRLHASRALRREELSAARTQVERILSLDVDGTAFEAVGERDEVVAGVQRRYPGLRPVCFWSWYEAAAWAIIGQRIRMTQAAQIKQRMSDELGESVVVNGVARSAFPAPAVLARLEGFRGLVGPKVERLRALGEAARRNVFDSASLRAMPREEALEALKSLPGIGPFSAELILLRGAGDPDHAPLHEPRFLTALSHAYRLPSAPDAATLAEVTAAWSPFRTWVTLLLRVQLEDDTHETAGAAGGDGG
ncbi:DNA-3-methyladenine glycosylase family protein [Herbiconiux sp. YIM B11900]|uniref:DNA-3-methyladenine glycosylase family protein n=1 Tax=Herbiconiux sp. YIM B11900 TaxID=3404131 RepID=UPI003F8252B0